MADIRDSLFGSLAVRGHFVLDEQIREALDLQRQFETAGDRVPHLGEILVSKGYMTPEQVQAVLQGQGAPQGAKFGQVAVQWHLTRPEDVESALEHQRITKAQGQRPMRLGEILITRGQLKPHQVKAVLAAQGKAIVVCTGCGARYNAKNVHEGTAITCPRCQVVFVPMPSAVSQRLKAIKPSAPSRFSDDVRADITVAVPAIRPPGGQNLSQQQIGSYQLLQRLGVDHSGELYKAFHPQTGGTVVIRVLLPHIMQSPEEFELWTDASEAAAELNHPNLQRTIALGNEGGRAIVVNEYIEGQSLRQRLDQRGRLPYLEAVDILIQSAEALAYGHSHDLIHGDLRPSHILIGLDGRVRVSGLGTPKQVYQDLKLMASSSGKVPVYAPPEVLIEEESGDGRSDIYSLCAIGYHTITGRGPQDGSDVMQVGFRLASQDIPAPRTVDPHLPPYLNRLLIKGLLPEPDERYQTIEELLSDLRKCRAGLLIQAPDVAEVASEIKPGVPRARRPRATRARQARRMGTYKRRAHGGHVRRSRTGSRANPTRSGTYPGATGSGLLPAAGPPGSSATNPAVFTGSSPHLPATGNARTRAVTGSSANMNQEADAALQAFMQEAPAAPDYGALTPAGPAVPVQPAAQRRRPRRGDQPLHTSEDVEVSPATTLALIVLLLVLVMGGLWLLRQGSPAPESQDEDQLAVEELPLGEKTPVTVQERPLDRQARADWDIMVGKHLEAQPEDHQGIIERIDQFVRKYRDAKPPVPEQAKALELRAQHGKAGALKTLPNLQAQLDALGKGYRFREADAEVGRWLALWGEAAAQEHATQERERLKQREQALAEELLRKAGELRGQEDWEGARDLYKTVLEHFDPALAAKAREERTKTDEAEREAKAQAALDAERTRRQKEAAEREAAAPGKLEQLREALDKPLPLFDLEAASAQVAAAEAQITGTSVGPRLQGLKKDLARLSTLRERIVKAAKDGKLREQRVTYNGVQYPVVNAEAKGPILDVDGGRVAVDWKVLTPEESAGLARRATDFQNGEELVDLGAYYVYAGRAYDAEKALEAAAKRGAATKLYEELLAERQKAIAAKKDLEAKPKDPVPAPVATEGPVQEEAQRLALQALAWEIRRGVWKITPEKTLLARAETGNDLMLLRRELKTFNQVSMEIRGAGDAAGFSFSRSARYMVKPTETWQKVTVQVFGGDQLRLLIDGEPRASLEDVSGITTEHLGDVVYIRAEGTFFEVRNFTVDGKVIGEPAVTPAGEPAPQPEAAVQDPAHAQALRVLGWEPDAGVWIIQGEVVAGSPVLGAPEVRLKREFKDTAELSVEVRGTADAAGFSFGAGQRFLVKPSGQWKKLELRVGGDGKPALWVDGVQTRSLEDTSKATAKDLGANLYLMARGGKLEFRNFRAQ